MAEMTQKQAIEMVTNLRFYAQQAVIGAPDNRITHEEKANKAAGEIIAALTRPAPQPSDVELRDQIVQAIYEQNPIRKYEFGDGVTTGKIVPWTTVSADDQFRYLRQANAVMSLLPRLGQQPSADDDALVDELIDAVRGDCADWINGGSTKKTRAEVSAARAALLARLAASRVPDELMAAIATLFHGYCRLEDTGLKFTMQVGPEPYLQIGIDPHAHVKAWRVIHDTLYPAAPAPEVKK